MSVLNMAVRNTSTGLGVPTGPTEHPGKTHLIAIIGGGPKGMYGFERLAAHFAAQPPAEAVEIHVFNRTPHFGAGDVYHPEQPDYLLINYSIGNINMWIDEEPPAVVPNPLSLTEWLRREHASPLNVCEHDYASRARVGRYLEAGFRAIADHLPGGVTGRNIVGEVCDIRCVGTRYRLTLRGEDGNERELDGAYEHILLATGHPRNRASESEIRYHQFAREHAETDFIPFVYPVEPTLTTLPPDCTVGIKGMGLTFVDAALALTEGKGGQFVRNRKNDQLLYYPSGAEPAAIHPFSRSGLPMWPRGPAHGPAPRALRFFTEEAVQDLRQNSPTGKVDFEKELWPLLKQEMIYAFYSVFFQSVGWPLNGDERLPFSAIQAEIDALHQKHPYIRRFSLTEFLYPLSKQRFASAAEHHSCVVNYMRFAIAEAKRGEEASPWAAVAAVWKYATPIFGAVYQFGGLTPAGQRTFEQKYASPLHRITFGPPIESMEKMVALAEAGILKFGLRGDVRVNARADTGQFHLCGGEEYEEQQVQCLVDARIPKISLRKNKSTLYDNLLRRGLIRPFENRSPEPCETPYSPGCLALSENGAVIDAAGQVNGSITVTGTPTEGIMYDNDSLSRTRNNVVSGWAARLRRIYAAESH